jgi:hypothetical protein
MQRASPPLPPPWDDDHIVQLLVDAVMLQVKKERAKKIEVEIILGFDYAIAQAENKELDLAAVERLVTEAEERGTVAPLLAKVLLHNLSPATLGVVADVIWATSQKRTRGRPPMSDVDRRKTNPLHLAAEDVAVIAPILRTMYPNKKRPDILARSAAVAAEIARRCGWTVSAKSLLRHVTRAHRDRRRVTPRSPRISWPRTS